MAKYLVTLAVDARFCKEVEAPSPAAAVEKAQEIAADADFGELEDLEWTLSHVEDENGNFVSDPC